MVETHGPFDLKKIDHGLFGFSQTALGGSYAVYKGVVRRWDFFGNYNYGVAAKALGFRLSWALFWCGNEPSFKMEGRSMELEGFF